MRVPKELLFFDTSDFLNAFRKNDSLTDDLKPFKSYQKPLTFLYHALGLIFSFSRHRPHSFQSIFLGWTNGGLMWNLWLLCVHRAREDWDKTPSPPPIVPRYPSCDRSDKWRAKLQCSTSSPSSFFIFYFFLQLGVWSGDMLWSGAY